MYSLQIEIPIHPTDSNKILGVNRFAKHAIFKKVKREVGLLVHGKKPKKPLKTFIIAVERHSAKTLDYDNFIASLKPAIDGLKIHGIIFDDSWKYIQDISVTQKISDERKLVFKVNGIDE